MIALSQYFHIEVHRPMGKGDSQFVGGVEDFVCLFLDIFFLRGGGAEALVIV